MKVLIGTSCTECEILDPKTISIAQTLCEALSESHDLVFGGCPRGMMGISYRIFKNKGRKIIGVVSKHFENDLKTLVCDEAIITDTVGQRMDTLIHTADIALFLAGGDGTFGELYGAIEHKKSERTSFPIILYNEDHFFDPFIEYRKVLQEKHFIREEKSLFDIVYSKEELLEKIEVYQRKEESYGKVNNG